MPETFVRLAEDRGLALPFGEWSLRRACRDAARWPNATVAVNISTIQFRQPDFAARTIAILDELGFDPGRLELEITENALDDAEQAEQTILDLRSYGIRVALDDYGSGNTSLIYMRRFAFDKIKIDRTFLASLEGSGESALIVRTIVQFAHALGLRVVAEGIETEEQFRLVTASGCGEMQGFYFSPAVSPADVAQMLERGLQRAA
jgi:EAL domain-containing protein (putative c-di-GMP-specific phosphodiesterase class I)